MSIETLTAAVEVLTEKVEALARIVQPVRETYTLAELAELPEAPSLKTLQNNPARQPNCGKPDGLRGGKKAWRRETVEKWRRQLDKYSEPRAGGAS